MKERPTRRTKARTLLRVLHGLLHIAYRITHRTVASNEDSYSQVLVEIVKCSSGGNSEGQRR